jgi:nitric oxide reductase large subunit
MEVGSIWRHGSYVAPDRTANWLLREAMFVLLEWAGGDYPRLPAEGPGRLRGRLTGLCRANTL